MIKEKLLVIGLTSFCLISSTAALASAFQSFEQGASGLGDAYSGMAATADDATTEFYNPAGLVRINHPEIAVSSVLVAARSRFKATSSVSWGENMMPPVSAMPEDSPLGANPLPGIHFATPINDEWFFGFGITVPFGLETDYDKDNAARFFATRSIIKTFNFAPSLAFKLGNRMSIGFGLDAQYLEAQLDQQVDFSHYLTRSYNPAEDGSIRNSAHEWGMGIHLAALYQFNRRTRIGLSYRSPVYYSPDGKTEVYIPGTLQNWKTELEQDGFVDTDFSTKMTMPETATASFYHRFNRWSVLASLSYTYWSRFQDLTIRFHDQLPTTTIVEHFHNTFRYAAGVNYQLDRSWLLRAGFAYDDAPTNGTWRTIRLPDADRIWWACGFRFVPNKTFSFDFGYSFIHIKDANVYQGGPVNSHIAGYYDHNYANLLGAQMNINMG